MRRLFSPAPWVYLFAAGLLVLAGCEKDEIRSYTVHRPPPETVEAKVRLLAAVFTDGRNQWFFKLAGPLDVVGKHAKEFDDFVESVRFTGQAGNPVEWKIPETWEKTAPGPLRYAGFFMGPRGKAPELTVFKFDQVSPLLTNVERWCRLDLGRKAPRNEEELAPFVKEIRAGDKVGERIDMTGPGPRGGKRPMAGMGGGVRRPKPLPITYTVPDGWTETGPRLSKGGLPLFTTFEVREGERKAVVEVSLMAIRDGMQLDNVKRWRSQVGLGTITQEEFDKELPKTLRVGEIISPYYDFIGPRERMLVVQIKRNGMSWYFKMTGNADLVGRNKRKFESLVQSVKFTGAADE